MTGTGPSSKGAEAVFALIICIDIYKNTDEFRNLQGCVNDAQAFRSFLLDTRESRGLQVPESNIEFLENEGATRAGILEKFKSHFLNNPDIPDKGEATMILFFAGHGSRVEATDNLLLSDGKVETICPSDERTLDADGNYVHGIPDYVLGWMLKRLAEKKGGNITVILDSCHSGGMGREVGRERTTKNPSLPVPLELDSHLWMGSNDTAQSHLLWSPHAPSHVLLAGCREDESAREITYADQMVRGRFSESLITWLRRMPLEDTTYTELLNRLPTWSGQTPHCGGANKDQLVFKKNYPATGPRAVSLTPRLHPLSDDADSKIKQSFLVPMGSVEGVVPGTEFAILAADNTTIGTLVAHSVEIHEAVLVAKGGRTFVGLPDPVRARVEDWKNNAMILHVFLPPGFAHTDTLFPLAGIPGQPHKFVRASTLEGADVALRSSGDEVVIERLTSTVMQCARETRLTLGGNAAHLHNVLDGIGHFNYFLDRHNGSAPLEGFTLEMHRLMGEYPARKPDPRVGNMIKEHEVKFRSEPDAKYGFTIRNDSAEDLFPYLFYFDPVKYTIQSWHSPAGAHVRAPLRASGGTVTIGMGGERAFEFSLGPHETSSSGFIKVFVTTEFIDLGWIEQEMSPFDPKFEGTGRLEMRREPFVKVPTWDALHVVLTMTDK
ncbi:caspase domain-containing protein [Mycena sp. CBHHK59/15]|nr:caspase domain-containing protein [Mycena sp. CBHHK59/15]